MSAAPYPGPMVKGDPIGWTDPQQMIQIGHLSISVRDAMSRGLVFFESWRRRYVPQYLNEQLAIDALQRHRRDNNLIPKEA